MNYNKNLASLFPAATQIDFFLFFSFFYDRFVFTDSLFLKLKIYILDKNNINKN